MTPPPAITTSCLSAMFTSSRQYCGPDPKAQLRGRSPVSLWVYGC